MQIRIKKYFSKFVAKASGIPVARPAGRGSLSAAGFSLLEIIVVMSIITMLSIVILVSFSGVNDAVALRRERFKLALAIREAQNASLSVRQITGGVTAPAYGVRIGVNEDSYFLFADTAGNNVYDSSADPKIGNERTFEGGITINSMQGQLISSPSVANVVFASPEADARFFEGAGSDIGVWLEIILANRSGALTSRLRVRTSGQVTLR